VGFLHRVVVKFSDASEQRIASIYMSNKLVWVDAEVIRLSHPSETSGLYSALQKPRRKTSSYEQPPFRPENLRHFLCFCNILRPMLRTFCDTSSSLDRGSATLQCNFAMAAALCEVTASRVWVKWLFFHVFGS
jgi:hypothetical protein